jgi:hypothetical protein
MRWRSHLVRMRSRSTPRLGVSDELLPPIESLRTIHQCGKAIRKCPPFFTHTRMETISALGTVS